MEEIFMVRQLACRGGHFFSELLHLLLGCICNCVPLRVCCSVHVFSTSHVLRGPRLRKSLSHLPDSGDVCILV